MHAAHHHGRPHHDRTTDSEVERPPRRGSSMRTDDASRREVAEVLGGHLAEGRLDMLEYEDRLEQAFAARTEGDLAAVLADLPQVATAQSRRRRRRTAQRMMGGWLWLCALFIAIWLFSGGGYFWPVWPMLGTGIATVPGALAVWRGTRDPDDHA